MTMASNSRSGSVSAASRAPASGRRAQGTVRLRWPGVSYVRLQRGGATLRSAGEPVQNGRSGAQRVAVLHPQAGAVVDTAPGAFERRGQPVFCLALDDVGE